MSCRLPKSERGRISAKGTEKFGRKERKVQNQNEGIISRKAAKGAKVGDGTKMDFLQEVTGTGIGSRKFRSA
jgi:hypothetical protein